MLANGTIFATICTPDMTSSFVNQLVLQYQNQGMTEEEAKAATEENLVITGLPKLPADGDITVRKDANDDSLWVAHKTMGGVNGYGISSYTKNREWSLKFVEFATSLEMVTKRAEMLGVVPARADALQGITDEATRVTFENLDNGTLVVMPSISAVGQIWLPISSGFKKIATDGCGGRKYTLDDIQSILEDISDDIYKAIHTFS